MGCRYSAYLSVSLKYFKCEISFCTEMIQLVYSLFMLYFKYTYDFKCDIDKTCISYLFYSPARPSCLILLCLVSDVGPVAIEAECAFEAVEPPVESEWQPNDVM